MLEVEGEGVGVVGVHVLDYARLGCFVGGGGHCERGTVVGGQLRVWQEGGCAYEFVESGDGGGVVIGRGG